MDNSGERKRISYSLLEWKTQNFLPELQAVFFSEPTLKLSNGDAKALGELGLACSFLI